MIQGRIDTGGKVLLYDCTFGGPHNFIGQKTEVVVTIGAAFWNLDIDRAEGLCFQKVSIDFGEIIEWSGLCSYEWEMTEDGNEDRLVWKHEKDVVFQIDEEVTLRISAQPGSHKMWSYTKELGISAEMLFLNLAQALETYHARFVCDDLKQYVRMIDTFLRETYELEADAEYSENEKSWRRILINQDEDKSRSIVLKSRLGYLFLARFEYVFSFLDYSREDFIERMVHTRNYYTHYSPDKERLIFPFRKLPYVNGILMAVLQYYMMREIGIPDGRIKKKVGMQIEGVMRSYRIMGQ